MKLFNNCHFSVLIAGASAGVNLRKNYQDEVIVREGESVELVCSADKEVGQCTWETADGQFRPFYPGAKYPRLSRTDPENNRDCGVEVRNYVFLGRGCIGK